jgi:hypothetical protein
MHDEIWELELRQKTAIIQEDKWWEKWIWWYSIGISAGFILGTLIIAPMLSIYL